MKSTLSSSEAQWADQLGLLLAQRIHESPLPHDVSERLRIGRHQAVMKASVLQSQSPIKRQQLAYAPELSTAATHRTGKPSRMWLGLGSAIPLLSLVIGLFYLSGFHSQKWLSEISRIDAALLADELPPDAFTDPGFLAYLKSERSSTESDSGEDSTEESSADSQARK
mgnify:FL=1